MASKRKLYVEDPDSDLEDAEITKRRFISAPKPAFTPVGRSSGERSPA
jgi:hypothetical protein